jgi:hypothetical protein
MEFMNRGLHQAPPKPAPVNSEGPTQHRPVTKRSRALHHFGKLTSLAYFILLISGTILVVAILVSLIFGKTTNESTYVDKNSLQAVFLNNGQVYFGKVNSLNKDYVRLSNVYYLRVNNQDASKTTQTTNPNDVSLAKLGCELHGPKDQMIINRSEVTFWENLQDKDHSQVTKAVQDFVAANPSGQKCDAAQSTSTTQSNTTNGTGATVKP